MQQSNLVTDRSNQRSSTRKITKQMYETLFSVSLLDQNHIDSLKIAFDLMDKDKSGAVSAQELKGIVNKFDSQITDMELEDMVAEAREFRDGEINFSEMVAFMADKIIRRKDCEGFMKRVFDYFDTEGNELIGPKELKEMMNENGENLTDQEVEKMLEEGAFINEGKINFADFIRPMVFPGDQS